MTTEKEEENGLNTYYPFVELLLKETQTIFTKKLDLSNETRIIIADMELLEILSSENEKNNNNNRYKILSEFTQNLITGERDDYENMVSNDDKTGNIKRRRELRRSSIKEEQIFKIINDDDDENLINDENDNNTNITRSLNESINEKIKRLSKRNTIMVKSNLLNNSLKEENENNININYNRKDIKKSTIKVTKNDNNPRLN